MRCLKSASIVTSLFQTVVEDRRSVHFQRLYQQQRRGLSSTELGTACFRGMLYFAGGGIVATQDKPGHVVKVFSRSNVIEEVGDDGAVTTPAFNYEGTSRKARKTVAMVFGTTQQIDTEPSWSTSKIQRL